MIRYTPLSILAVFAVLSMAGCSSGGDNPAAPAVGVSFKNDIQPIIASQCLTCHANNGPAVGTLVLHPDSAYVNMLNRTAQGSKSYKLLVPFLPDSSFFYLKVARATPPAGSRMPMGGPPLATDKIDLIRKWIEEGAKNN